MIFLHIFGKVKKPRGYFHETVWAAILWGFIILVGPIFLGLILGLFYEKEFIRELLHTLEFNPVHIIPTGWDYKFSKIQGHKWLVITLKDGRTVYGLFGCNSFSSSDCNERYIYILKRSIQ